MPSIGRRSTWRPFFGCCWTWARSRPPSSTRRRSTRRSTSADHDDRADAYAPPTPVTEPVAIASADTIVRLQYPAMRDAGRTVTRRDDLGVDRFVIVYTVPGRLSLVRIAVEVVSGRVTSFYLP